MFKVKPVHALAAVFIVTMFFSVSCTNNTATTPQPTATATATPGPIYVDDFTDGDLNNSVSSSVATNYWFATQSSGGSHTGPSISSSDTGSACLAMTGTAQAHYGTSSYLGTVVLGTFTKTSSTAYLDASAMTRIKFRVRFDVVSAGSGTLSYNIRLNDNLGNGLGYDLTPTPGTWQTMTLNFADFSEIGSTRQLILSSLGDISITVTYTSATLDDTATVAVFLDDVVMERN